MIINTLCLAPTKATVDNVTGRTIHPECEKVNDGNCDAFRSDTRAKGTWGRRLTDRKPIDEMAIRENERCKQDQIVCERMREEKRSSRRMLKRTAIGFAALVVLALCAFWTGSVLTANQRIERIEQGIGIRGEAQK